VYVHCWNSVAERRCAAVAINYDVLENVDVILDTCEAI
jgi:hypothetical protein